MVFSIDGNVGNGFGAASSGSVSLTTTQDNDVIVVTVGINYSSFTSSGTTSVVSVVATGLTFTQRPETPVVPSQSRLEMWWAPASTPFSGTITVNLSDATSSFIIIAMGIAGSSNITNPWDPAGPATGNGAAGTPLSIQYTPKGSNDIILAFFGTIYSLPDTLSAGTGFTFIIQAVDPSFGLTLTGGTEYDILVGGSGIPLNATMVSANGAEWNGIVDALVGPLKPLEFKGRMMKLFMQPPMFGKR